jgi:hypothetical protein
VDWVKLSARYYLDRAIAQIDDAGEVMFTRALAYSGDQEEGGFIPAGMLHVFSRSRRYEATARTLVVAGLWLPVRGGYQITRWEEWQSELEAIARRRSADRDRKRRERAAVKAQLNGMSRDESADSPLSIESKKNPPIPPQAGGHRGQHPNCRACGTSRRGPPPDPPLTPTPPRYQAPTGARPLRGDDVEAIAAQARQAITRQDAPP